MQRKSSTWTLDPSHISMEFAVKHMGIATVRGRFKKISGTVETGPDNAPVAIRAVIDAASIDTGEPQRDTHLRSGDFLDAAQYPTLTFQSTAITPRSANRYRVDGVLTIRNLSRPVSFEAEATAPTRDPWGNVRAGVTASGTLNRKEWGLTWNQALELGALLVGEEVRFTLDVEVIGATAVAA